MKKILITGGNGFLGSALVHHFVSQQYKVLVVSRDSYNLTSLLDKITFVKNTSEDYTPVADAIHEFSPEYVIHAAWHGGNNYNDINHLDQFYKNMPLSLNLLEIINALKVKPTFIGVGSFTEYGIINTKAKESDVETPVNYYGLAKFTAKNITQLYCANNNIKWMWIRPCYIYGPRDVGTRLIPNVIKSLLSNKPLQLDSCNVTIDYLHVYDFATAIHALIESNAEGVYNICSGHEYQLRDIIEFIYNNISPNNAPVFQSSSSRTSVSRYICGANDKLKSDSKWNSAFNIYDGLLNTIDYYKQYKN